MILSRAFRDMVSRTTLKGVVRRNGEFSIVRHELSQYRLNNLVDIAIRDFGYSTSKEAREDVSSVFLDSIVSKANLREVNQIDLLKIVPGSLVSFNHDGGYGLRLIAAVDGSFVVLSDDEHNLLRGDILHCLDLRIKVGTSSEFQVVRYGEQYPSREQYLHLEEINTLVVQANDGENLMSSSQADTMSAISGLTVAYSLQPSVDGCYFLPAEFTEDSTDALFRIQFNADSVVTFEFNEEYVFRTTGLNGMPLRKAYQDTLGKILSVCEYDDACLNSPIGKLRSRTAGSLRPFDTGSGEIILQVTEKARIGL